MIRKSNKTNAARIRVFSAAFLLLLYITGNVQFESFHQVFHSLEKSLHSSEQEKDPCHRAIYHDTKDEGCDHKTHVTAVKKCPLCHVVPFNDQYIFASTSFQSVPLQNNFDDSLFFVDILASFTNLPARAPPVF